MAVDTVARLRGLLADFPRSRMIAVTREEMAGMLDCLEAVRSFANPSPHDEGLWFSIPEQDGNLFNAWDFKAVKRTLAGLDKEAQGD